MLKNDSSKQRGRKLLLVSLVVCLLLAAVLSSPLGGRRLDATRTQAAAASPAPLQQIITPWTAVGSTGVVDEAPVNAHAFGAADIGFRPGSPATILLARYNVTNTFDNNPDPNFPGWTTLEMGSIAPLNTIVEARLFRIRACDFQTELLCVARNRSNDSPCAKCEIPQQIDFTSNLYYVEVSLDRTAAPAALPRMFTLRIF